MNGTKYYRNYANGSKIIDSRETYVRQADGSVVTQPEDFGPVFYISSNYEAVEQKRASDGNVYVDSTLIYDASSNKIVNNQAKEYYKHAYDLREYINSSGLYSWVTTSNIVCTDMNNSGRSDDEKAEFTDLGNTPILTDGDVESEESAFNIHRKDVIKNSINNNLSVAISNFNTYGTTTYNFQMPKLKDSDWDKLTDNIGMISFMQGMHIGGKVYNGYAIVNNNKNSDVVMEDSIYINNKSEGTYGVAHKVTENKLSDIIDINQSVGIFNIDLERRGAETSIAGSSVTYYFPINSRLSYNSIVTQDNNFKDYMNYNFNASFLLASKYYTALGRERYSLYRQKLEF